MNKNIKKGVASLVGMAAVSAVMIVASDTAYNATHAGGSAEGVETTAPGFGGDIVVSTTISDDGKIENVEIVDSSTETPELGQAAAPEVAQAIVDNQSLDVDGMSGATITSNAVKAAVEAAIVEKGLDVSSYKATAEETEVVEEVTEEAAETEAVEEATESVSETASGSSEGVEISVPGFGGDIVVSTTISDDGKIESVEIVDSSTETPGLGQAAAPEVAQAIVDNQSLDVDGMSGATITSDAVKAAVEAAIVEKGLDVSSYKSTAEAVEEVTEEAAETEATEKVTEEASETEAEEEVTAEIFGTEYTAMAACYEGEMPVVVVINEGKITAIKLPELSSQGAEAQGAALTLTKEIVAAQSPNVDGISGATVTSDGIKSAVAQCLEEAGIVVEDETEVVKEIETEAVSAEETEIEEIEIEETELLTEEAAVEEAAAEAVVSVGEYTANAACYEGEMPVIVVVNEEGKITAVKLPELGTQGAEAQGAALALTKEIILAQSPEVDGISGATVTSDGIKSAVAQCLTEAGME